MRSSERHGHNANVLPNGTVGPIDASVSTVVWYLTNESLNWRPEATLLQMLEFWRAQKMLNHVNCNYSVTILINQKWKRKSERKARKTAHAYWPRMSRHPKQANVESWNLKQPESFRAIFDQLTPMPGYFNRILIHSIRNNSEFSQDQVSGNAARILQLRRYGARWHLT
jgi:hypothetical protein